MVNELRGKARGLRLILMPLYVDFFFHWEFLEAQILSNYIDFTHSLTRTPSLTGRLAISDISPLFVDRSGRSLRVCHLEYVKEAISECCRSRKTRVRWGVFKFKWIQSAKLLWSLWTLFYPWMIWVLMCLLIIFKQYIIFSVSNKGIRLQ